MKRGILLTIIIFLVSCVPRNYYNRLTTGGSWYRSDTTSQQTQIDESQCELESERVYPDPTAQIQAAGANGYLVTASWLFDQDRYVLRCMGARGYVWR